jgi:aspartyl-tRNA(Asn)/glutamyl-tRNA(Gln) amidotransferase subunit B
MRGKEEAHDYRYFPDPDLVPVKVDAEWLGSIRQGLPELPAARAARFVSELGLPAYDAEVLTGEKDLADYFEKTLERFPNPKKVSNWIMTESLRDWIRDFSGITYRQVTPLALAKLLELVENGTISGKIAKMVFEEMKTTGDMPTDIIKRKGLVQISDSGALETQAREIIAAHPKEAADYKAGKTKVMGFFVGQLMKKTKGQANPKLANEILQRLLSE